MTGAGYADCDGLYSISNMSSIWDNKRIVYERVAGGWRPMDKRYNSKVYDDLDDVIYFQVHLLECSLLWRELLWLEHW